MTHRFRPRVLVHVRPPRRTLAAMNPEEEELGDLVERASKLRASVARLHAELVAVQLEQAEIDLRLQSLGAPDADELKTQIDRPVPTSLPSGDLVASSSRPSLPTLASSHGAKDPSWPTFPSGIPGLPPSDPSLTTLPSTDSPTRIRSMGAPVEDRERTFSALKAGVTGAGLTLLVVAIVLLAFDLGAPRAGVVAHASSAVANAPGGGTAPSGSPSLDGPESPPSAPSPEELEDFAATTAAGSAPTLTVGDLPGAPLVAAFGASAPRPAAPVASPTGAGVDAPDTTSVAPPNASASAVGPVGTGAMTIVCNPKCDAVLDNNAPLAANNLVAVPAPAGSHRLTLFAPNGVKKTVTVTVVAGQTRDVHVSMERDGPRDYGF